jgi:hypothetical protein
MDWAASARALVHHGTAAFLAAFKHAPKHAAQPA